jgi:hypothetical protein
MSKHHKNRAPQLPSVRPAWEAGSAISSESNISSADKLAAAQASSNDLFPPQQ